MELGNRGVILCCDDKAKVPTCDPGVSLSTGVRGKKTLVPTTTELVAYDHITKSSLCLSIYLKCQTPSSVDK